MYVHARRAYKRACVFKQKSTRDHLLEVIMIVKARSDAHVRKFYTPRGDRHVMCVVLFTHIDYQLFTE